METESTFLITHAEEDTAVLRDVESGRIHTLSENPGVTESEVLSGTLAPEPPLEVTWRLVSVDERRSIPLERSDESLTPQEREISAEQDVGEITRKERAGDGEIHVISVPSEPTDDDPTEQTDPTEQAIQDVLDDNETLARAARLDATRVEVRSNAGDGVVSIRYLP